MNEYDESARLRRYVVEHYSHLLTEEEQLICSGWRISKKAALAGKTVEEFFEDPEASRLANALGGDPDGALERVAQRVLEDYAEVVSINRCPKCERVVATPKAQQCLWCGHDWH